MYHRLQQWRGIATRYEKTATICPAALHIAGIFLWSSRWSERNGLEDASCAAGLTHPGPPTHPRDL
ncbi:hypothetical protein GCM10018966_094740 [Streptomyces yanii]